MASFSEIQSCFLSSIIDWVLLVYKCFFKLESFKFLFTSDALEQILAVYQFFEII